MTKTAATTTKGLSIGYVPVESLIPYARNARTHTSKQISQIAASIHEFGFNNPVLVDKDRGIIAGHGRVLAAKKLGMTEVPAIELSHMNDTQRRAYILADNKFAINAGWDDDLLRLELGELKDDIDIELTGFDKNEIERLFDAVETKESGPELGAFSYRIVIDCEGENDQRELLERFEREGFKCRALIS